MTFQTPDLCDENEGKVKVATPMFQAYGGKPASTARSRP